MSRMAHKALAEGCMALGAGPPCSRVYSWTTQLSVCLGAGLSQLPTFLCHRLGVLVERRANKFGGSRLEVNQTILLLLGISFLSFATLVFEIAITRISLLVFNYHFAFIAVSVALLGLGLGGVAGSRFKAKLLPGVFRALSTVSALMSLSIPLLSLLTLAISYFGVLVFSILMFIPFLASGLVLAISFRVFAGESGVLYFVDLVAAAVGAMSVVVLLDLVGAVNTVLVAGATSSVASTFFAMASGSRKVLASALVLLTLLSAFSAQNIAYDNVKDIPVSDVEKGLHAVLGSNPGNASVIESRWSAFGRTDLVEIKGDPNRKMLFVDGSAGTFMYRFDGSAGSSKEINHLKQSAAYFPFYVGSKERVLVIGPGGGVDVLLALVAGSGQIDGVEVNSDMVELVRKYSGFNGGIYTSHDNVRVFVDEGRSFLKRSTSKYDIIMLNIPVTRSAQGVGGYSLAENFLFTTESFLDYLSHLREGGRLVIVAHSVDVGGQFQVYKFVAIALTALRDRGVGIEEAMRRIAVLVDKQGQPVFIVKSSSLTDEEVVNMQKKADELGLTVPFLPNNPRDHILKALASGQASLTAIIADAPLDIRPPTDENPFFYKFERGLPPTLSSLLIGVTLLAFMVLALYRRAYVSWKGRSRPSWFVPYYFLVLGVGFMLIEVSLIQRMILFLGQPTLAISVLLSSILLAAGLGSFYSRRLGEDLLPAMLKISMAVGILALLYVPALPFVSTQLLGYGLAIRVMSSVALVLPLGFPMGMLFPLGIRNLARVSEQAISWMWGLNGIFSVLGSILAVTVAMLYGFNMAIFLAGFAYLSIFLLGALRKR